MTADFLVGIRGEYNQFTKAEKKVADYILSYPRKILFMSTMELAEVCNVGDTNVFRFCKTMNYKGYQKFKMLLSLNLNEGRQGMGQMEGDIDPDGTFDEVVQKVLASNVNAPKETQSLPGRNHFERVIRCFHNTVCIYFYGVSASMTTAVKAADKFLKIESKVYYASDSHIQTMMASTMTKGEVAMVFSYPGATKDTIHVTQLAKQAETKTACITRLVRSPLTTYGDMVLLCDASENPLQAGSSSAEVSQLFLVDLLYTEYYRRYYNACSVNSGKTSVSVMERLCQDPTDTVIPARPGTQQDCSGNCFCGSWP